MNVWRVTANWIGPDDYGAYYLPTLYEAKTFVKEEGGREAYYIEVIKVRNPQELCSALNEAMGYGGT